MDKNVRLVVLNDISDFDWDSIVKKYSKATVFHLSCWHQVLNSSISGRVIRFKILKDDETFGYWCGVLLKKFGIKIFGSPLPGSGTDYMYPLLTKKLSANELFVACHQWAKNTGVVHIELGGEIFTENLLKKKGYNLRPMCTYRVDLLFDESVLWQNIKPTMRNKIRKAKKNGVIVSPDNTKEFASRYFDMLKFVFRRQGLVPTYSLDRVEKIIKILSNSGNIVNFTAWKDSEPLSTIILLKYDKTLYFWGGASYKSAYAFGANDIIHWYAFLYALNEGFSVYDTCGGGDYKKKFGGELINLPAGYLSLNPIFYFARNVALASINTKQKFLGIISKKIAKISDFNKNLSKRG